jgi:hypothetical protein
MTMRACPFCAEQIQDAAVVCRFCNRDVSPLIGQRNRGGADHSAAAPSSPMSNRRLLKYGGSALGVLVVVSLLFVMALMSLTQKASKHVTSPQTTASPIVPPTTKAVPTTVTGVYVPTPKGGSTTPEELSKLDPEQEKHYHAQQSALSATVVSEVMTPRGALRLSDTMDDSLERLKSGTRTSFELTGNRAVGVYVFPSGTYRITFDRSTGQFRIQQSERIAVPTKAAPTVSPAVPPPPTPAPSRADQQAVTRRSTPEQIAAARSMMEKVRSGLATLDDDGRSLDVRFAYGLLPSMNREQVYQLMEAIANADAVLTGQARLILFYDPTGKRVGKASVLSGITVDMK